MVHTNWPCAIRIHSFRNHKIVRMNIINLTESELYTISCIRNELVKANLELFCKVGGMLALAILHKSKLTFDNGADKELFCEIIREYQLAVLDVIQQKEKNIKDSSDCERNYMQDCELPALRNMYNHCDRFQTLINE